MKKCKITRLILPFLLITFLACQNDEDSLMDTDVVEQEVENYLLDAKEKYISFNQRISDNITTCSEVSTEIPLISWPNIQTGTFIVDNNDEYLIADFEMDESADWYLQSTRLLITVKITSQSNNRFYTQYRKYVYPVKHEKGTKNFTYMIPLSDLKLDKTNVENCLMVAGIARINNGNYRYGKFAIAMERDTKGRYFCNRWLHEYCLADCILPDTSPPLIGCAAAWVEGIEYTYNFNEVGYYNTYSSEMVNNYPVLFVIDSETGKRIDVGDVEIFFWGASSVYDLLVEFRPYDGYDIQNAQIYVGILDPLRGPETFQNQVTFTDQNSLVFKTKTDFEPIYLSITATVCSEENVL